MQKCEKHPKYSGKKMPSHQCVECLNYHVNIKSAPRIGVIYEKTFADKSKYNRKEKHLKAVD